MQLQAINRQAGNSFKWKNTVINATKFYLNELGLDYRIKDKQSK